MPHQHHCPSCRTPIQHLMMIDPRNVPEYYCERCAKAVKPVPLQKLEPAVLVSAR